MSLTPVELIAAHPWQRVVFTTYALSLSFFEAVVLDALVRGGAGSQALILADVDGVRASIGEQGAHRVGKDYEVEPVAVTSGVFHPKMSVLSSLDECHVLVGSGNLTFGGWGGNCEIVEHLHPSFAADAIADVADFFEPLTVSDRVRHGTTTHCLAIAADLRRAVKGRQRNGNIRVFHNLDQSLTEQIAQTAAELGGAVRLVVAAPFWDAGSAIDHLCEAIGPPEVFVHSHARGCIEGAAANNWPREAHISVCPVRLEVMDTPDEAERLLHAKAFELLCRRGRILVSGSANPTRAALDRDRNIEACVVRMRKREAAGKSSDYRKFRRRYAERIESHAKRMCEAGNRPSDLIEIERQYRLDMEDDFRELKRELRSVARDVALSQEMMVTLFAVAGATVLPASGAFGVGALFKAELKYREARRTVFEKHPMSWLHLSGHQRFSIV